MGVLLGSACGVVGVWDRGCDSTLVWGLGAGFCCLGVGGWSFLV